MVETLYSQMIVSFVKMKIKEFHENTPVNLLDNLSRIFTTELGAQRISRNLNLPADTDVVAYCKLKIQSPSCTITRNGKKYYCNIDGITITVNAHSFTIITAHKK